MYTLSVLHDIQAYLLTGGSSRRMGKDKASLLVDGASITWRIAASLQRAGYPVVILGREPVPPFGFQRDRQENQGPLCALVDVHPDAPKFFVVSCDLPRFDPRIVEVLNKNLDTYEAVIPMLGGKAQPLCALYRREALEVARRLVAAGERRVMVWVRHLNTRWIGEEEFYWEGISIECLENANTPEDWKRLTGVFPFDLGD